jgi:XTP/dITP diphosphohydrolase
MKRIVFASHNPGKVREIARMLAGLDIHLIAQSEYCVLPVEETGLSFVENAIIKARHATEHTGLPAIADDSGLEVDALDGEPGIYSARYAGPGATDQANNERLLAELCDADPGERSARYQCVLVYLRHPKDPTPIICQGTWEGRITEEPRGGNGFGYDPLFYLPAHGCTAAELDPETKNHLSHRGQALRKLLAALEQQP